jgi:hypothetical protein
VNLLLAAIAALATFLIWVALAREYVGRSR